MPVRLADWSEANTMTSQNFAAAFKLFAALSPMLNLPAVGFALLSPDKFKLPLIAICEVVP